MKSKQIIGENKTKALKFLVLSFSDLVNLLIFHVSLEKNTSVPVRDVCENDIFCIPPHCFHANRLGSSVLSAEQTSAQAVSVAGLSGQD